MTQTSAQTWTDGIQAKLMAALDAAWMIIDTSDDPARVRLAREKARVCGELAAAARKIAGMTGTRRPRPVGPGFPTPPDDPAPETRPVREINRLKGGGRGRL